MAVTAKWYGIGLRALAGKAVDFDSDTIKVSLHTSTYTPDQDVHDFQADLTNEVTSDGYTAGGATIANCSLTYTGATNVLKFDGDDVTWTGVTLTARYAVVYDSTPGAAATNPLLLYVDFGEDKAASAANFTITWAAGGIATITAG